MRRRVDYDRLVNRNWGFLSPQDQGKIKTARVLLAGCGFGSNVATLAARTGFTRFIVADGDTVEIDNLNRQAFRLEHVGRNKAEATTRLIEEINPGVEIEILPHFITEDEVPALVSRVDFIVNMVDPGPTLFTLNRVARSQNKLALFPLNVGFGGVTLAFSPQSATLEEILGGEIAAEEVYIRLVEKVIARIPNLKGYIEQFSATSNEMLRGLRPGPQLGIATSINASLVVTAIVKYLRGEPLKVTPESLAMDAWFCS